MDLLVFLVFIFWFLWFVIFSDLLNRAFNRHLVNEQLQPFVPVTWVNVLAVGFLLVDVGFICDVEDRIKEVLAELISSLSFRLLTDYSHLVVAIQEGF